MMIVRFKRWQKLCYQAIRALYQKGVITMNDDYERLQLQTKKKYVLDLMAKYSNYINFPQNWYTV